MARGRGAGFALVLIAAVACSNEVSEADRAVCDLSGEVADAIAADVSGQEWRAAAARILDRVDDVENGQVRSAAQRVGGLSTAGEEGVLPSLLAANRALRDACDDIGA